MSSLRKNKIQRESNRFLQKALYCTAYVTAAVYIQKKYLLNNPLLKFFCALNPRLHQLSLTHENLLNLKPYFETLLSNGCEYSSEIQKHGGDSELLLPKEKERLNVWWNNVFKTNRYPVLSSLVHSCLRIFTGMMVECSVSMMNDIIDSRSGCMETETYSAIMTAKYSLKCSK